MISLPWRNDRARLSGKVVILINQGTLTEPGLQICLQGIELAYLG